MLLCDMYRVRRTRQSLAFAGCPKTRDTMVTTDRGVCGAKTVNVGSRILMLEPHSLDPNL